MTVKPEFDKFRTLTLKLVRTLAPAPSKLTKLGFVKRIQNFINVRPWPRPSQKVSAQADLGLFSASLGNKGRRKVKYPADKDQDPNQNFKSKLCRGGPNPSKSSIYPVINLKTSSPDSKH